MDDSKGTVGTRDVKLACTDDTMANVGTRDGTLAYNDVIKRDKGTKDVTLAYDDDITDKFVSVRILQWKTPPMMTSSTSPDHRLEQG